MTVCWRTFNHSSHTQADPRSVEVWWDVDEWKWRVSSWTNRARPTCCYILKNMPVTPAAEGNSLQLSHILSAVCLSPHGTCIFCHSLWKITRLHDCDACNYIHIPDCDKMDFAGWYRCWYMIPWARHFFLTRSRFCDERWCHPLPRFPHVVTAK